MHRAILLLGEDWEGLFIDGTLVKEGHRLDNPHFWLALPGSHSIGDKDLSVCHLEKEDNNRLMEDGNFPQKLSSLIGKYE